MSPRSQNIAVGAFVFTALAVLVFGVYFLKETFPGRAVDVYHARFEQVSTLQAGDPVKVNGVKLGRVRSLGLEGRTVLVDFEVERGVRLPRDSEVRIQNIGLMGERQLGIRLGASPSSFAPGETLSGRLDAGIAEAMGAAGEALEEAEQLVRAMRGALDSTVGRPEFAARIDGLLASAEQAAWRLNGLARDIDPQIREGVAAWRGLGRDVDGFFRRQEPGMDRMLRSGEETIARAAALAERGERAARDLEEILAKLNAGEGTAGALLNDTTLHRELTAAARSADSLFRSIRRRGLNVNLDLF